ncbi:unnamed protein product [Linum tenue]|uniref:Uncharacterized protein n=1 Tax=Linum tenue TaxID=586396 RepID=A0AAV0S4Q8_9ROSI|nr:unnamed protein product [Linum tenue]
MPPPASKSSPAGPDSSTSTPRSSPPSSAKDTPLPPSGSHRNLRRRAEPARGRSSGARFPHRVQNRARTHLPLRDRRRRAALRDPPPQHLLKL